MNFDQIYSDITTKVLPKVAEGFQITKEYAYELFGRYIKYLIVSDTIMLLINIIIFIIGIILIIKLIKKINIMNEELDDPFPFVLIGIIPTIMIVISFINVISYTDNLFKDIFIPEVRIYELYQKHK